MNNNSQRNVRRLPRIERSPAASMDLWGTLKDRKLGFLNKAWTKKARALFLSTFVSYNFYIVWYYYYNCYLQLLLYEVTSSPTIIKSGRDSV